VPATLRSLLFVPGDSPHKMAKAVATGADALILDLEDAVAEAAKPEARRLVRAFLAERRGAPQQLWVRINALSTAAALPDIAALVGPAAPDVLMLPKCDTAGELMLLARQLDVLEAAAGLPPGHIGLFPVITETAAAVFATQGYVGPGLCRLRAVTWGAEDLTTALGTASNRGADGRFAPAFTLVRANCLAAAAAQRVPAVETVFPDFRHPAGLADQARAAARDGFAAMMAIHPGQVDTINDAFGTRRPARQGNDMP
jgi:citrate lyase subunit beta/citryl-CoA lyase